MTQHTAIKIFEEKRVRTVWDDQQEKWYFCINDVIAALADCKDPVDYFKKVRKRDPELDDFVRGTNCPLTNLYLQMGNGTLPNVGFAECITISESIPSKKAEPFKRWLAQVGAERIHQMQDP